MPHGLEGSWEARSSALGVIGRDDDLERSVRRHRFIRKTIRLSTECLLLAFLLSIFLFRFPQIEGRSMQPNIASGYHVLINTVAYEVRLGPLVIARRAISRGDVVAFYRTDALERKLFLKRVIALPGDRIGIHNGTVSLNGQPLVEPYQTIADHSNLQGLTIPSGTVFVMGDNRAESDDSRSFGPLAMPSIVGKAVLIIWPLSRVRRAH